MVPKVSWLYLRIFCQMSSAAAISTYPKENNIFSEILEDLLPIESSSLSWGWIRKYI